MANTIEEFRRGIVEMADRALDFWEDLARRSIKYKSIRHRVFRDGTRHCKQQLNEYVVHQIVSQEDYDKFCEKREEIYNKLLEEAE